MEILLPTTIGIIALWIAGIISVDSYKKSSFTRRKKNLRGRIVKLSAEYSKKQGIGKYAEVRSVYNDDPTKEKILGLEVKPLPTRKDLTLAEGEYKKVYLEQVKEHNKKLEQFNQRMLKLQDLNSPESRTYAQLAYYNYGQRQQLPQPPRPPAYNFRYESDDLFIVPVKYAKLMPKNFDTINEAIIKQLDPIRKEGRKMKHMPRLFQFAIYIALVTLLWDFVAHVNDIALFVVQNFVSHR